MHIALHINLSPTFINISCIIIILTYDTSICFIYNLIYILKVGIVYIHMMTATKQHKSENKSYLIS